MPTPPSSSGDPSAKITIDRSAIQALRAELHKERQARDAVQKQLNRETEFSRRAAEETLTAREDRERFRRLMAVGLSNEQNAVAALSKERENVERLEQELARVQRELGQAEGRAGELAERIERLLTERRETRSEREALVAAHEERLVGQAEHHRQNSAHLTYERGVAVGAAAELRAQIPPKEDETRAAARTRARGCWIGAGIAALLALILLPATLIGLFSGERPEYLRLALGMGPGWLLGLVTFFGAAAYVLSTRALAEFQRLAQPAPARTSD